MRGPVVISLPPTLSRFKIGQRVAIRTDAISNAVQPVSGFAYVVGIEIAKGCTAAQPEYFYRLRADSLRQPYFHMGQDEIDEPVVDKIISLFKKDNEKLQR